MTRVELAAKLLRIEATCAEARANMLLEEDQMLIAGLVRIDRQITEIQMNILNPDKTRIYLAK